MHTSISKRLLAGLLSIVMVLSLFVATPAKTEAASRETLTIEARGYDPAQAQDYPKGWSGIYAGDQVFMLTSGSMTFENGAAFNGQLIDITVNNGDYDLDPDSTIYEGDAVTFTYFVADTEQLEHLKTVQVYTGYDEDYSWTGYEICDFTVSGKFLMVTCHVPERDSYVGVNDFVGLQTNIKYQYYFPTEISGFRTVYFTMGVLTWKYTTDNGKTFTYPTYPILGSAKTANEWYAVEMVISAKPGFDLSKIFGYGQYTKPQYTANDGRTFTFSDLSSDGKSCVLQIGKIYPITTADFQDPSISSIELSREVNFGTNDVILPADVSSKMPKSFSVTVNGEKKDIESRLLANGWAQWVVYKAEAVQGNSANAAVASGNDVTYTLKKVAANEKLVGSDTWDTTAEITYYYAVLEPTAAYLNTYKVAGEGGALVMNSDMFYASVADGHGLLDEYYAEMAEEFHLDKTYGWVIRFTVNNARKYGAGAATEVAALKTIEAPTISFYGYGDTYSAYAFGQGTTHFFMKENVANAEWSGNAATHACPKTNGAFYKAYVDGTVGFCVESPIVVSYFDVNANTTSEISNGALSISMGTPAPQTAVFYGINGMGATMGLADAIDCSAEAVKNITIGWDGITMSGRNRGYEWFTFGDEVTAQILIPVKGGYKLNFTPVVNINGEPADNVELVDNNGWIFISVEKTYKLRGYGIIGKDATLAAGYGNAADRTGLEYCLKAPWTNLSVPYAGATVPTTLEVSGESQDYYYDFEDITWYENGVEFSGKTFTLGKRYTAVVTLSQPYITADVATKEVIMGMNFDYASTGDYIQQAKAVTKDGEVIITYEFGECKSYAVTDIQDCVITVPNGMSTADFYNYVMDHLYTKAMTSINSVVVLDYYSIILEGYGLDDAFDVLPSWSAMVQLAFANKYPGAIGYNPTSTQAQTFKFNAYVNHPIYSFNVIINVEGKTHPMTFDANGGVYTGNGCSIEEGKPYGFKYDPKEIYREGYFFAGWYTAAEGGTRIYAKTIADGKVTKVYAHWVKVFTGKVWALNANSYGKGRLTVTVTKIATKYDGFEFQVSTDGINWRTVNKNDKTAYFTGLESGAWKVRARAYRRDSAGKLVYGAYSAVTTVTVK